MNFGERVGNFLFHDIIVVTRYIQIHELNKMFARFGYPNVSIVQSEADRLIYAGRSEFLFDVVRPINNRVKHFGGANCLEPSDYVVALPADVQNVQVKHKERSVVEDGKPLDSDISVFPSSNGSSCSFSSMEVSSDQKCFNCTNENGTKGPLSHLKYRIDGYSSVDRSVVAQRYLEVSQKHANVDWKILARSPFILVSFGSVAQVENMPSALLRIMVATFSSSTHLIVWQTNSDIDSRLRQENITLGDNLILLPWAPIKEFLGECIWNMELAAVCAGAESVRPPQYPIHNLSWPNKHNERTVVVWGSSYWSATTEITPIVGGPIACSEKVCSVANFSTARAFELQRLIGPQGKNYFFLVFSTLLCISQLL